MKNPVVKNPLWLNLPSAYSLGLAALLCTGTVMSGCGRDSIDYEKDPGDTMGYSPGSNVIIADTGVWVGDGVDDNQCAMIDGECVKIEDIKQSQCGSKDAQADVVLLGGKVLEVICYPPRSAGIALQEVATASNGTSAVPQNSPNTVVTFDEGTNGQPISGNLDLKAEQMIVMGNGIDKTIIDGNLTLSSNNARVRGVTINGNVTIDQNSNSNYLSFCKIKGNLEIKANDITVVHCQVFGNVIVEGNNASLINLLVGGNWEIKGKNSVCQGNYAMDDNGDRMFTPEERAEALSCTPQKT